MGLPSVVKSRIGVMVVSYELRLMRVAQAQALVIVLLNIAVFVVVVVVSSSVAGGWRASAVFPFFSSSLVSRC